jgi:beta-fructofuranosidase
VFRRSDGSLGVNLPDTVRNAFSTADSLIEAPRALRREDGRSAVVLGGTDADTFLLRLRITPSSARSFAIRLFEDPDTGEAYAFTVRPGELRLDFDRVPNYPWFRYDNRGLDRPITIEPGRPLDIDIVVDDTIATLYVDGIALNARMYRKAGRQLSVDVVDGSVEVESASLAVLRNA